MLNDIDIHIVTVATESKYYFEYLKKSCLDNGINLTVLAYGKKWQGFAWRFKLMLDYLKKIKPNDIVCFIDGYDVICVRNLLELKNEFIKIIEKEQCKIIIGHEKHVKIKDKIFAPLLFGRCKNLSINCGTYIGYANDILKVLSETFNLNPDTKADDQLLITKYCNMNEKDIYIDVDNKIFLTIVNQLDNIDSNIKIDNDNNVFYNNNKPFFIHGADATYLDNIIIKLGYNYDYNNKISDLIKKDIFEKSYGQLCNHIYQNREIIIYIILIIIIVLLVFYYKLKIN